MQITFKPTRRDDMLTLSKSGDALTINDKTFDFSPLANGAELPPEAILTDWIAGPVRRKNGILHVSLLLPHGPNAPIETKHPEPLTVKEDGPITVPAHSVVINDDGQERHVHAETSLDSIEGEISWSMVITASALEAQAVEARVQELKSECATLIVDVIDERTFLNLQGAMITGDLDDARIEVFKLARTWIEDMQRACRNAIASGNAPDWPRVPPGVSALATEF